MAKTINTDDIKEWFEKQPKYVLYGSALIFLGVLLIIIGLFML